MKKSLFSILMLSLIFIPLESNAQIDFLGGYPSAEELESIGKGIGGEQGEYYLKLAEEQREHDRTAWKILFGIISIFSLIFYFITWFVVKKIFHKKHPKLLGLIVVSIFISYILYFGFSSIPFRI